MLEEYATTCCYAKSEKAWIADPQGLAWEAFLTSGESTVYGDDIDLGPIRIAAPAAACCAAESNAAVPMQPSTEPACCSPTAAVRA